MSVSSSRLGLASLLAVLCLCAQMVHAQTPTTYWIPNLPAGFGGSLTAPQSPNTYGNFSSFDGTDARGGASSHSQYNLPNGWFVGGVGSGLNSIDHDGAFGRPLSYQGVRVGYNFQNAGGLPLTFYAGFDTLKYNDGLAGSFSSFNTVSGTLPGYRAHAGVEFQPTPNVSLSLGIGFTQQPAGIDNSPSLFGTSPFAAGGQR
jgi:opacity protein-like surface antigen